MTDLYLGLISGTSTDGVDAVLAELGDRRCTVVHARSFAYPRGIAERVRSLIAAPRTTLADLGSIDIALGRYFGDCALALLREAAVEPGRVTAIGHHGQTVYHKPEEPEPFTMQLGDPSSVAAVTGIPTVADFRALDMAFGGQGAPLVPAFHEWLFSDPDAARIIVNIGGIANVTALVPGTAALGFDTGPGNTLLDGWIQSCRGEDYDDRGQWAASGRVHGAWLERLLGDPYFSLPPPKSTGREYFNSDWLGRALDALGEPLPEADVQATLTDLTAASIARAAETVAPRAASLVVCGGGAHNEYLLARLRACSGRHVQTTAALGLDPDWVEGAAFAWLARARLAGEPGNLPSVTGARQGAVLGGLYCPLRR